MSKISVFSLIALVIFTLSLSIPAFGLSDSEKTFLSMYFTDDELQVVSATRSLKAITRVAENIEVVTARDIELMNAHTVADTLSSITGVQIWHGSHSPGFVNAALIQGSDIRQVAVFMDGIFQPWLTSMTADLGQIPVQMVEKIEIIKGPASSVWGSSLGGVINIITKSPRREDGNTGLISASYGERETGDFRAELSGRKERFGYYLYAGRLSSDGVQPFSDTARNSFYSKLAFDISKDTELLLTLFHTNSDRTRGGSVAYDFVDKDNVEQLQSTLTLKSALSKELELTMTARASRRHFDFNEALVSTGDIINTELEKNTNLGASAQLIWRQPVHTLVAGADYDRFRLEYSGMNVEGKQKKYAAYLNDTLSIGKFSITPGIRLDRADIIGNFISPSLGVTYTLGQETLLRAYVARGFTEPSLFLIAGDFNAFSYFLPNHNLKPERVWSYQLGAEMTALKYLWLKVTAFRHEVSDSLVPVDVTSIDGAWTYVNAQRVRREGVEADIRTKPLYNFTLSAGAAVMRQKDMDTGEKLKGVPTATFHASLKYDDEKSFRALLNGRYIDWNMPSSYLAKYSSTIFDLHLIKKLITHKDRTLEAFFSAHNIFNGSQYWVDIYPNAGRWAEAGLRMRF